MRRMTIQTHRMLSITITGTCKVSVCIDAAELKDLQIRDQNRIPAEDDGGVTTQRILRKILAAQEPNASGCVIRQCWEHLHRARTLVAKKQDSMASTDAIPINRGTAKKTTRP